jgi:hypothetical protein
MLPVLPQPPALQTVQGLELVLQPSTSPSCTISVQCSLTPLGLKSSHPQLTYSCHYRRYRPKQFWWNLQAPLLPYWHLQVDNQQSRLPTHL